MKRKKYLTIEEKRIWLADIFRDDEGIFSQADKFKAMVEDTRLAELQESKEAQQRQSAPGMPNIMENLPPPMPMKNEPS